GVVLFHRKGRETLLSENGQRLLPYVQEGFKRVAEGVEAIRRTDRSVLSITVGPAFTIKWLVPRLHEFRILHPDIDVRISTQIEPIELETLATDLAIRIGDGNYPGYRVHQLFEERFAPLCSPKLAEGRHPLRKPEALKYHVLLHTYLQDTLMGAPNWLDWLKYAGVENVDGRNGLFLELADHAIQAAIDGAGVILGFCRLSSDDIRAGRLVEPFPIPIPSNIGYYLVCPQPTAEQPKISAFRKWILDRTAEIRSQ
ncbi:MAG: LysR substrate-binding domain-containing protein, partial [Firmicutes bacterium]|nr:LysR substrate-binding domain-containing protein [Bacillota bacterium]